MTDKSEQVRAAFPRCVAVADEFRAAFGSGVKITFAQEGGNKAGRATDETRFRVISGADLVVTLPKKEDRRGR